jgi:hypothetical protein
VRGHADAETLAAFREELLPRRKAARVSAHLAACPRCAALDAQLAGVTAVLTRTTAPPMPDALTARIQAALAAEAASRSTATGAAPSVAPAAADGVPVPAAGSAAAPASGAGAPPPGAAAPAPGAGAAAPGTAWRARVPGTGRRAGSPGPGRPRLTLRVAMVAVAVAVVAGGGYGVAQLLSGSPSLTTGGASSRAGAGSAAKNRAVPRMSTGGFHSPSGALAAPAGAAAGRVVSSGTNYQRATLGAQASAVLARFGPNAHASARPVPSQPAPQNRAATGFPNLQACVAHVAGARHPLLADVARYQGKPAVIVVLPGPPGNLRALVIGPGCTGTTAHVIATATLPSSG